MKRIGFVAVGALAALSLAACNTGGSGGGSTGSAPATSAAAETGTITMWVNGTDTPQELRDYLVSEFKKQNPGSELKIEEQSWEGLVNKLTTALPDAANTPDVVEIGNTQASTFTAVGAFLDITDMYSELGGDDLLPSFVEAGKYDGKNFALPYYFGSRYVFYRADLWKAAGQTAPPATLDALQQTCSKMKTDKVSGFAIGGQDWRNGISWIFANGGDLAKVDGTTWTSTLNTPEAIAGLKQWQTLYTSCSNVPDTESDAAYWEFLNGDPAKDNVNPQAATMMAPNWARWSLGKNIKNDKGETVVGGISEEDAATFDIFALPGKDGGIAPSFAGGSNLGISAKSQHPQLAKNLLKIIYSADFQKMLGGAGLGPANKQYVDSLGTDKFAKTSIEAATNSKLTPAAPGWANVEGQKVYEEMFQKIAKGGDVAAIVTEYDAKLTPMLNGKAS